MCLPTKTNMFENSFSTSTQDEKKKEATDESSTEQKPRTGRAMRQTSAAVKKKGALVKKATLQAGKKSKTPIKLTKAAAKSPKRVAGKQAKITDFRSPKRQMPKNSPLKVLSPTKQILNGSTKGTNRRTAQSRTSSSSSCKSDNTRKRTAGSPDENIPTKKRAATNEKDSRWVKFVLKYKYIPL